MILFYLSFLIASTSLPDTRFANGRTDNYNNYGQINLEITLSDCEMVEICIYIFKRGNFAVEKTK